MIKVILAEDHNIVRNGIKSLLLNDSGIDVIGEGTNGLEILAMGETLNEADIILADIYMQGMDGISLLKELKTSHPHIGIIILSMLDQENYVYEAFKHQAKAYLLKNVSADELIFCIKHVAAGGEYFCSELSIKMLLRSVHSPKNISQNTASFTSISPREKEMLQLLADGYTNQEMADKLFVSKRTIEGYRQQLIEKTKSKNTASLIKFAMLHDLLD